MRRLPLSDDEVRECYVVSAQLIYHIRKDFKRARKRMLAGYPESHGRRL